MHNFLGKDGFVWWMGKIENRIDPLGLGRCQVRIFGWHVENKEELPTEDLPWALPLLPTNNSKSFASPRVGDWIVGFFTDGLSGQAPVMMGVLPGMQQDEYSTDNAELTVDNINTVSATRTEDEIKASQDSGNFEG
jgi:hypothetical protein